MSRRTPLLAGTILVATTLLGGAGPAPHALLSSHVPAVVSLRLATRVGAPDPAARRHLAVALPMHNTAALDALVRQITDPGSPSYRHYLSVAEFTRRFGPNVADYDAAQHFFAAAGLTVTGVAANRALIDLDGSVADVERVFHVRLNLYRNAGESRGFVAPDREPTLDLAVPVQHVVGLDDASPPASRLIRPSAAAAAGPRATGSGPGGQFIGSDMRAAYASGVTLTGAGQSVGLMELGSYNESDVVSYFSHVGQPLNVPVRGISTDGTPVACASACDDAEQVLDIEYAISMAPGLAQVQVYVANSAESVLNRMVSDNTSKQLSTSWGWNTNFATDDPIFKEMIVQGQSFLTASGDYSSLQASGPWPEEDANLTAVGGTNLFTLSAGGKYKSETGWSGSAGGPSVLKSIKIPRYQVPFVTAANQASATLRNVPDIAAASTNFYICANGGCNGGNGGTSFSSPILAGYVALANQQAAALGEPAVGFVNPVLYRLGGGSQAATLLHDVTSGRSGKYTAVAGFDLVTGLGSPYGQAMIDALANSR